MACPRSFRPESTGQQNWTKGSSPEDNTAKYPL